MMQNVTEEALIKIKDATDLNILEEIRIYYFGKSGVISAEMKRMATLDEEAKKSFGKEVNDIKNIITVALEVKRKELKTIALNLQLKSEKLDLSLPSREIMMGSIHPVTQAKQELLEIFIRLGFEIKEGPSIEDDWHNFTALNIPESHPARQMHDTFYLSNGNLLRTHTSPVQIRSMMSGKPPFRFVAPGRTYRCDSDMTHTPMFHQIEVLMIDKGVNMGNLKYLIQEFITQFFERDDIDVRFRPSFFPFTEPSAEVDIRMKGSDKWLEVFGCGMVHPKVLANVNIDDQYQGFALGMGIERFAMLKYGIEDLRQMFDGDKRWLDHYSFSAFDIPSFGGGLTR